MPNKRRRNPPPNIKDPLTGKVKKARVTGGDDDFDEPDPRSREFLYDDIDEFHTDRDKILVDSDNDELGKDEFEEVLPLDDEDSEEEEEDELLDNDFYSRMAKKDEIASDLEDEDDDDLPDNKAWGKKKSAYYGVDYDDGDYGGFQGNDEELAEAEEKEALAIQKRLLEQINEDDFGLDWIKPPEFDKEIEDEGKITLDLSKMSRNEKLELLRKESPEFLQLVEDFKTLLTEVKERLEPLIPFVKSGQLKEGAEYILFKHELVLLYCTNISFYMVLKCRGTLSRSHPVLKKLAYFKKFLKELEVVDEKFSPYIENALEKIRNNESILEDAAPVLEKDFKEAKPKKKKLRIVQQMDEKKASKKVQFQDQVTAAKTKVKGRLETQDEKEALEMYKLMKEGHEKAKKNKDISSEEETESEDAAVKSDEGEEKQKDEEDNEEFDEKRGITYQIAKNKGLMPHRKKEYKNPRVKHRMKFRKAKIRRKGQVREPRKEIQRYGGEISGIRIGVKHGRKIK